ncbi:hypothetical protein [Alkalicoccobacillus porphyridii]|uniref:Uncharacterized protein n=1 Tax=Alkalicoccobacillus porphyridii TaxID=2597270 RepID=A0A553ZW88_9BACI|nr:hypothetical protein [Alkalicoccobacillus porphyridii]TSB45586.1 hypothetical protein FN960_15565 [Alkalicoccobacillus porphyridii]
MLNLLVKATAFIVTAYLLFKMTQFFYNQFLGVSFLVSVSFLFIIPIIIFISAFAASRVHIN